MGLVAPRGFDGLERDGDGISNVDGPGANIGGGRCPLVDGSGSAVVAVGSSSSPSSEALNFKSSSKSGSTSGSMYSMSESWPSSLSYARLFLDGEFLDGDSGSGSRNYG
jgi:hypothetical protein